MAKIFTIGTGKRFQFAQRDDGFWFKRCRLTSHYGASSAGWGVWVPTGSRNRPADIWYNPRAGEAKLPKD